jgi:hypothetical protein
MEHHSFSWFHDLRDEGTKVMVGVTVARRPATTELDVTLL